jgi:transcription elongation factor SPT6
MAHFQLFYGNALSRVQEWEKQAARDNLEIGAYAPKFKLCGRTDKYQLCIQSGLELLAREFGLTPEEFSENFTEYANKNEIRQVQEEPSVVAQKYVSE